MYVTFEIMSSQEVIYYPDSILSKLARYGQVNHYKKFWLLQTQLEKQEQSSSSSLSLGNTSIPSSVKESSKAQLSSSLLGNGDHHNAIATQYGGCRADMAASSSTNCSNRVGGGCNFSYNCSNEPACVNTKYFNSIPRYGLEPACIPMRNDGVRLSLAVNCENVSHDIKFGNQEWPSSSMISQPKPCEQQQILLERPVADECSESSESSIEEEKRVWNSSTASQASPASCTHLKLHDQHASHSGFQSSNTPLSHTNISISAPMSSASGYLRTCTLCGTTKTPLWRSGPDGPKSLCNACGIRVKKTKRLESALQAAASGSSPSPSNSSYKGALKRKLSSDTHQKAPTFHKKKRAGHPSIHISPIVKQELSSHQNFSKTSSGTCATKLPHFLGESGKGPSNVFAKDVEEAAVLLMALSCGRIPS